jgi:nucleotide-binding universal stress UspA family protein
MNFRAIVVGTDGSTRAERAVERAADIARFTGARLHIVTARSRDLADEIPGHVPFDARTKFVAELEATAVGGQRRRVKEWAESGVDVEFHVAHRDPVELLLEVAGETGADLIVVGNRGMGGAVGLLRRSVPNRLSHLATCDVLVVDTAA